MRKISLALTLITCLFATSAFADFTGKNAAGATITFKNPGDCTSVVCVPEHQVVDSTGAPVIGTTADGLCSVPTSVTACTLISLIKALTNVANSATPVTDQVGGAVTPLVGDPCQTTAKSFLPITATTSLVKVIATGVAAKKIYVCQLILTTTAANNVAVFEATTATTCATSPVAVYGAGTSIATAANGFPFPANGGISLGNGGSEVAQTTVNNNDLCIGTSAATPLTGGILYVTR